jgi:hypothetical protein
MPAPALVAFTITVKRITDESSPQIQELLRLDRLKGKARLPYEPLPDTEVTLTHHATDRRAAYRWASGHHGLRFTGQLCEIWIDGAQELAHA